MNIVIILNLVIAILATTYNELNQYKRGLFFDTVVKTIPIYKTNKTYGALVCAYPPLNVLMLTLTPVYFLFDLTMGKNAKVTRMFNWSLQVLFYLPILALATGVFILFNLLCLPIAYIAALITKYRLLRNL